MILLWKPSCGGKRKRHGSARRRRKRSDVSGRRPAKKPSELGEAVVAHRR
jgi:hypothetical protein